MLKSAPPERADLTAEAVRPAIAPASLDHSSGGPGPAVILQDLIRQAADASLRKWTPRRTLAFVLIVCGGFWAAVAWAALKLFG